jgi:hypothetical protein
VVVLGVLGAFGFVAHFALYQTTSVSAFIDRPEFYYTRFVIRDGSGQSVREVGLSIGLWSYVTAAIGVLSVLSAIGSLVAWRRCHD